ncbi:MAG: hypothetical protein ACRDL6_02495 [Solirubrobacterales bacterium]
MRNIVLTTAYGGKKKRTRFPVSVERWGMAVHDAAGSCGYAIPKALSLSRQGSVVYEPDIPVDGPELRVRKRRFSHQDVYDVPQQYGTDHVDYRLEGRFQSRRRVTGTVVVNVVKSFADGRVETCSTGLLTWGACAGDLDPDAPAKACLGTDPEGGEPLSAVAGG